MKKEIDALDATPSKRLYLSIIADYDLSRCISELIDNALDIWVRDSKKKSLEISVELDMNQQTIRVTDNAGGVKKDELSFIVGPGQTGNDPNDKIIGIFGVGTKRAVVALAQDIRITTRHNKSSTHQVEIDQSWLDDENWELPVYEVDSITQGTTIVNLQKLRFQLTEESISQLRDHLEATYARFLVDENVTIRLDQGELQSQTFENWSYPPEYSPRRYSGVIPSDDGGKVDVEILAGLTNESSPAGGEYGVYFYCNDRLIARALKNYEVGFTKGIAGQPHPSVSLMRVIVSLNGPAELMPWNSSKSGIYSSHAIFVALRTELLAIVKDFASLSRRWEGQWSEQVFRYDTGEIVDIPIQDFPNARKSYLPPLPKKNLRYGDRVTQANRGLSENKPWTTGLFESIVLVDSVSRQRLRQKNRASLILLDSTLEIALKEFLVHESGRHYSDKNLLDLFEKRYKVVNEVKQYKKLSGTIWKKINFYYGLRNKLVHERVTVDVDDKAIADYRKTVETVLKRLFGIKL